MFWNATMPAWLGIGLIVVIALLALYFAFVARRNALAGEYTAKARQRTIDALVTERDGAREQRDKLNTERDILSREVRKSENAIASYVGDIQQYLAQNADLREALQEAQAEIKALQMNTIEIPEVAPEPVKRTRKKAGAQ